MFAGLYCPSVRAALENPPLISYLGWGASALFINKWGHLPLTGAVGHFCWSRKFRGICSFKFSVCFNPNVPISSLRIPSLPSQSSDLGTADWRIQISLEFCYSYSKVQGLGPSKAFFDLWQQEMRVSVYASKVFLWPPVMGYSLPAGKWVVQFQYPILASASLNHSWHQLS